MSAIALAIMDLNQREKREERFLQIERQYEKVDWQILIRAFAHLQMAFEANVDYSTNEDGKVVAKPGAFDDILGRIYMECDQGNAGSGQFFTPYEISKMMARLLISADDPRLLERGFIRLSEPAAGAGGMVIATADVLNDAGFNYQQAMHAQTIDVDLRCVHMTFIQFAMLHIPAVVVHGNSLSMEAWSTWYTPAHILGGWGAKLRADQVQTQARRLIQAPAMAPGTTSDELEVSSIRKEVEQMTLF